jgi:hypothetical protein
MGNLRQKYTDEEWAILTAKEDRGLDREITLFLIGMPPQQREELRLALEVIAPPFYRLEGVSPTPSPEDKIVIANRLISKIKQLI